MPKMVDAIFARAEWDPNIRLNDDGVAVWRQEDVRVELARMPGESQFVLQRSTIDEEVATADILVFDATGIVQVLFGMLPAKEAQNGRSLLASAVENPSSVAPSDHDEMVLFGSLLFAANGQE